jgi:NADH-quinone oxidoreductase subunit N
MLHVVAYGVTNLAMFLGVSIIYDATGMETIRGMSGMARRAPFLGVVMAVALFSLAGLPIFAGFASKFYLFNAVATQGLLWLASIGVLTSLVSLYYYLMIVRQMYIEQPEETTPIYVPRLSWALLGVFLLAMVYIGVYPAHLMDAIQHASDALFAANSLTQFVGSLD